MSEKNNNHSFAYDKNRIPLYIMDNQVLSGRKGYVCIGCGAEMEARKGDKRQYFAHVPSSNNSSLPPCKFRDESYRHKIAKEILQRIKRIKIPSLYKYPPTGIDNYPRLIRKSEFVEASTVKNEIQFYEDNDGEIKWGRNMDFKKETNKHLLIRPDVTFFDKKNKPILLIEIVVTNKISSDKYLKIKRLGINTIQIQIPKSSPEYIEKSFSLTKNTEWVYNYEQEKTDYFSLPERTDKGLPSGDEFQRRLSSISESYECRAFEINELIRGIRKSLVSERYREVAEGLRREVSRVEENTEKARAELDSLRKQYEESARKSIEAKNEKITRGERELKKEEREFEKQHTDLEGRYYRKKDKLGTDTVETEEMLETSSGGLEQIETKERELESYHRGEVARIEADFEKAKRELDTEAEQIEREGERVTSYYKSIEGEIREAGTELEANFEEARRRITSNKIRERKNIQDISERRRKLPTELERKEKEFREELEREKVKFIEDRKRTEEQIRNKFEQNRIQSIRAIEDRNINKLSRVQGKIREILDAEESLSSIRKRQSCLKRLRIVKKAFDENAHKNWI